MGSMVGRTRTPSSRQHRPSSRESWLFADLTEEEAAEMDAYIERYDETHPEETAVRQSRKPTRRQPRKPPKDKLHA